MRKKKKNGVAHRKTCTCTSDEGVLHASCFTRFDRYTTPVCALCVRVPWREDCPAVTPYERVLVGLALGYDERDVAYHLDQLGSPFSVALFERAREVLKK